MEMLDEKTVAKTLIVGLGGVALSLVVWILTTLIEVDKRTAVIAAQVEANHNMIKPMWEDYLRTAITRSWGDDNGNLARIDATTDFQAATETKVE